VCGLPVARKVFAGKGLTLIHTLHHLESKRFVAATIVLDCTLTGHLRTGSSIVSVIHPAVLQSLLEKIIS